MKNLWRWNHSWSFNERLGKTTINLTQQHHNLFRFNTLTFRHFLLLLEIDYQKFLSLGVVLKIRSDHEDPPLEANPS